MQSEQPLVVGAERSTAGPVSLTQGVYGARGNLELVACDGADGLWVFWFNADLATDPLETPRVPPGSWSEGLAFAGGTRYLDAQILQSTLGPDHLEVVALTADGTVESWYWSPAAGFKRRRQNAAEGVARFGAVHHRGTLHVSVEDATGAVTHFVSPPRGYPSRVWLSALTGPGVAPDATAMVAANGIPAVSIEAGTARAAASTRNGGTTELTWRVPAEGIRHLGVPMV